jgi:hypothetical protein
MEPVSTRELFEVHTFEYQTQLHAYPITLAILKPSKMEVRTLIWKPSNSLKKLKSMKLFKKWKTFKIETPGTIQIMKDISKHVQFKSSSFHISFVGF